ncbi:Protein C27A7.5 d [Aphelenchoides avenae]|nr:Protein C27A7.5 d [Aphelenchus avenae]
MSAASPSKTNGDSVTDDSFYYCTWYPDGTERIRKMSVTEGGEAGAALSGAQALAGSSVSQPLEFTPQFPLDESFTPKQMTILTDDAIRKLSATHLAHIGTVATSPTKHGASIQQAALPAEARVLVIYTGGTIGMRCNERGVYSPEPHYLPKAIRDLPPLNDKEYVAEHYAEVQVKPYSLPPVRGMRKRIVYWVVEYEPLLDSSDMTFDDWIRIAKDIRKSYQAYDGFVVLHGTDTLPYTACALSFMMENLGKPVIPVAEARSDGRENLLGALIIAGYFDIPEVCVYFNNKLFRGNRVQKLDNSGLDAFSSPNMNPLAHMDIDINVNYESVFRSSEVAPFRVQENLCRSVGVLRIFPSMPIEMVRATLAPPTQGVVLQTFGSGNMPSRRDDIHREISAAVDRGCLLLNVSQCMKGHVDANYETGRILCDAGVIPGSDMTTEAALTKLAYVLGKDDWDMSTKRKMLQMNLRGELTVARAGKLNELDIIPRIASYLRITSAEETRLLKNAIFPPLVCYAASSNDVTLLENLRLSGANFAESDYDQRTALHVAASAGNNDAVYYLLKHGASVHSRDATDENALLGAVRSRNLDLIRAIRAAGGQLVVPSIRIGMELCLAACQADIACLQAWHTAGATLNECDYQGRTALHVAVSNGLVEIVEFLCLNAADPLFEDHCGVSPLDECRRLSETLEAASAMREILETAATMFVVGVFSLIIVGAYGAYYGNDTCGVGDCHGCWVPATGPHSLRRSGDGKTGQSIKARDQPWMALIHYKDGSDRVCAGTLITDRHLLTARICVDKAGPNGHSDTLISPDSIEVTLACENGDGRCEYKVERIRTYQRQEGKYPEVAVIEFTKPVYEFDMTRKPVCIAESWMEVEAGKVNTVVWGVKSTAGVVTTRTLYAVNPAVVDFSQCEDWLGEHLPKTNLSHDMFCIERESLMLNEQGVYAGAPVVKQDAASSRYEQTGIVIRADEYHNVAAVTKGNAVLHLFNYIIRELTDCYLQGHGFELFQAKYPSHCNNKQR